MEKLNHVAIIVDGNGRWAKEKGLSRSEGHLAGAKNLENLILHVNKNTDIKVLSLFVFSTENFKRDKKEVDYLMNLFIKMFSVVNSKYKNENIKIVFSGSKENLSKKVIDSMKKMEDDTSLNTGLVVNFCLNYGGRKEIIDATRKIAQKVLDKDLKIENITEKEFSNNLYQKLPDVDFLIRTSGELRISNFLLWQISYAEFDFVNIYFPNFDASKFDMVIDDYYKRDRRFGNVKE